LFRFWNAGKQKDVPWSGQTFFGALMLGWGMFNLVEGVIDHHILGIHHVVERLGTSVYDSGQTHLICQCFRDTHISTL